MPGARLQEFAMDEEQIRELKGKLAEKQTALDTCLKGTGKVRASLILCDKSSGLHVTNC